LPKSSYILLEKVAVKKERLDAVLNNLIGRHCPTRITDAIGHKKLGGIGDLLIA
jgi:hypothetical protein